MEEDDFCDGCNLAAVQSNTPPASAGFLTPPVIIRERLERNQDSSEHLKTPWIKQGLKQNLRFTEF